MKIFLKYAAATIVSGLLFLVVFAMTISLGLGNGDAAACAVPTNTPTRTYTVTFTPTSTQTEVWTSTWTETWTPTRTGVPTSTGTTIPTSTGTQVFVTPTRVAPTPEPKPMWLWLWVCKDNSLCFNLNHYPDTGCFIYASDPSNPFLFLPVVCLPSKLFDNSNYVLLYSGPVFLVNGQQVWGQNGEGDKILAQYNIDHGTHLRYKWLFK